MKKIYILVFILGFSLLALAQENTIRLKSGDVILNNDFEYVNNGNINYYFMSFGAIPTTDIKAEITELGIDFLEYIPNNTFVVSIMNANNLSSLSSYGVISLIPVKAEHKLDPKIQNNTYPTWAYKNGKLAIKVLLYANADISNMQEVFRARNYQIDEVNIFSNSITVSINPIVLNNLATINEVWYIEPIDPPSKKENKTGRTLHRSNTINTDYASGRHYNGLGINIMMQDDGIIGPHIDYKGRADQSNCGGCSTSSSDDHGDHVAGTIMGSGNLDPKAAGMSNAAQLFVYSSSNNNYYDVPLLYQNNDVTITSKSYGNGCNAGYTSLSKDLDEQVKLHPSLIHVFSAGNSGSSDCSYGAGSGWGNITGGHKQGKNVLAVANLTATGDLANSSSRGPAADGRIKPDIGAKGTSVYSTIPSYDYDYFTGTSMACPGVAGTMGQLYQAYKELNGGQNPHSALMKAVLLNAADDLGNPGPDFKHGWGELNAYQAIKILENNQFLNDSIAQNGNNGHIISIPNGIKQINIMVYWHDKEGSVNAVPALVNDIDIGLYNNLGNLVGQSWVLDPTPNSTALSSNATYGNDHLNNMEQITLDNPALGNYVLSIDGFSIPFGPQEYWVVYQYITEDVELTYPVGGEGLVPGELEMIRWDASEGNTPFTLEYTTDGISWNMITNSVSSTLRYYNWTVPATVSNTAKVRITRNSFSDESDADFTIVGVPQNVIVDWVCPDSIYVYWNPVSGATDYEVSMLGNMYMDSMTTTANSSALILNPNPTITDSWFSVCAKVNGNKGRRAVAINAQPINNGCISVPLAGFSVSNSNSCSGTINFIDESLNQPNYWLWDFGDGTTSNLQNPTHTYTQEGVYDVSLFVSNVLGQDSILQTATITVDFTPAPIVYNDTSYVNPAQFSLTAASSSINWYADTLGSPAIYSGSPFFTPLLSTNTTYYAREVGGPSIYGGPSSNNIGGGGYYNNDRHLFIDCYMPSTLVSVDVYAGTAQAITFELRDNNSQVLEDTTITVQLGINTLEFNFDVPVMNNLELGISGSGSDLYRNSTGAVYPYPIGTIASITGHNSPNSATYHYFFYNLQMKENCLSSFAEATAVFMSSVATNNVNPDLFYSVFPNPASDKFEVKASAKIKSIQLLDVSGRVVFNKKYDAEVVEVYTKGIAKGVYALSIITDGGIFNKQLIIE